MAARTLRNILMFGAGALAVATASPAAAGQWWIFGDKIYNTGQVTSTDDAQLRALLATARARGINITAVVFRNNPGGDALAGQRISTLIRQNNLGTIFQGGCYSACATAFTGGVQRSMGAFDIPAIYTTYGENILGFHGGSIGGNVAPPATQRTLLNFMLRQLGVSENSPLGQRLYQAHFGMTDSQAFLRYRDPAIHADNATIFCPTGAVWFDGTRTNCTTHSGANLYTDGLLTRPGTVVLDDMLTVTGAVRGDLNPNFTIGELANSPYGVIRIASGATWTVDAHSRAFMTWIQRGATVDILPGGRLGAGGEVLIDPGAVVNLRGGTLSSGRTWNDVFNVPAISVNTVYQHTALDTPLTYARANSVIRGTGGIADNVIIGGILAPQGGSITFRPVAYRDEFITGTYDYIRLLPSSVTLLEISPTTTVAPIRNERADVHSIYSQFFSGGPSGLTVTTASRRLEMLTPVQILPGATLAVNFERGFYKPGQVIPLFEGYINPTRLAMPAQYNGNCSGCMGYGPNDPVVLNFPELFGTPYFSGRFTNFLRANDGTRVSLDPAALSQVVSASEDSLLGFDLVYAPMGDFIGLGGLVPSMTDNFSSLNLVARPAFEDTRLFANAASGDGLGVALRSASNLEAPRIANLLGALQFSSRTAARSAAGALRGDAYVSQALFDQALVAALDEPWAFGALSSRGRRSASLRDAVAQPGDMVGALMRSGKGGGEDLAALSMASAESAAASGDTDATAGTSGGWGELFVGEIEIAGGDGVGRLDGSYQGLTLGWSRPLGRVSAGAAFSYIKADSNAPGEGYDAESELLSVSAQAGFAYSSRGEVSLGARATRTATETTRVVSGIVGLEEPVRGEDTRTSVSVRLQHAYGFERGDAGVRLLAPIVAYQQISTPTLSETGGDFALNVDGETLTSLRLGAGFEAVRTFETQSGLVVPRLRVAYERETGDVSARATGAFAGEPDLAFDIGSRAVGRDILAVEAGVSVSRSDRVAFSLNYAGRTRSGVQQHMGYANVTVRF